MDKARFDRIKRNRKRMAKKTPMEKAEKRMKELEKGKIERSNKTLSTVNVVEMADGNMLSLTAYPDTKAGNAAAEKLFRKICKENCGDLTKEEFDTMVEDGTGDDLNGWWAYLVHSA